jgi:hypothetical protein
MRCGGVRRASCAPTRLSRLFGVVAATAFAALAAGCSSQQTARLAAMNTAAAPNATITFESIDGPPPEVFRKLVASLNDEATARQVAVVPRQAAATYRVRGYVTALVDRDKTSFAWVWDVYDTDKRRALRITGEEPAAARRGKDAQGRDVQARDTQVRDTQARDAWTAADERVLRDISRAGMERIATFLNASGEPPAAAPGPLLPVLVGNRDDSPEAAGIFRAPAGSEPPTTAREPDPEVIKPVPASAPAKRRSAAAKPASKPAAEPATRSAAATPSSLEQ